MPVIDIEVGQLWADNDKRSRDRGDRQRLRVLAVGVARCKLENEETGNRTWVLKSRMKPTSTGYRLVALAPGAPYDPWAAVDALERLVRRTPFMPAVGGITVTISMEQVTEQQDALRKAGRL